jgi:hypothetical protein
MPVLLIDIIKQACEPTPNVATKRSLAELCFKAAGKERHSGGALLCYRTLYERGFAILNRDEDSWSASGRFLL